MSHEVNDKLIEEANEHREYWAGTIWEKLFERALKDNDLERLFELIQESRREMFNQEYRPKTDKNYWGKTNVF
jgi:hypothetical protein